MLKVIIADDHPLFRNGIKSVLINEGQLQVIAEAQDGQSAYNLILDLKPDIAILDIEMPQLSGLEVCKLVKAQPSLTKIILLTMHKQKFYFDMAMQNAVDGYLLKDRAVEELLDCITHISKGSSYISPNIEEFLITIKNRLPEEQVKLVNILTNTEKTVLKLIGEGKTTSEIASLLFVSIKTVESHRNNLNKKLQLDGSKNALLKFAIQYSF